ncbi:Glutathione S-transferase T3-like [Phytophthora cinnamomi]|uniref:Glutathione S-transferase T3-like n=1 Tax=Phytophthora cinnamomi TaxID=4785 RepID=UPI003559CF2F|nr:Glutathione S-transferase T3-like [Phytophthora cinnamomi]
MHFQGLTATLVEELKRQNDLLEDQNVIALLKVDGEMIADAEARHVFQLLRTRYLKRLRTSHGYSNNGRTSTLV